MSPREPTRRLDQATRDEVVAFPFRPTVRNAAGVWGPAPSELGEVAYFCGGSPFVRFIVAKDGRLGRTRPLWVGSSTPILSAEQARAALKAAERSVAAAG